MVANTSRRGGGGDGGGKVRERGGGGGGRDTNGVTDTRGQGENGAASAAGFPGTTQQIGWGGREGCRLTVPLPIP